ncbi:MAG: N-6 DNA methylase [Bacteroidota bacterium]|nr:N-6 DNA methylase [Bacteroidota bacterium]
MVNKGLIDELLKNYNIEIVEKHLVYLFIQNNNLNIQDSPIVAELLNNFNPQTEIFLILSSLEINELKLLENYLELLIPKNDRKINGAFFTPTYVVDYIIKEVSPKTKDKCLDPSCGCGAFLIGLTEYYQKTLNKSVKETIKENIYGSDILDYNVKRAKIILSLFGLLNNEIIEETDFNIYHQDSLKADWKDNFEIIIGNPPYVK